MKKLLMALVLLPLIAAADGNFTWITESNGAGTVSIVGIDGCPKGVIRIPSIVDGKTVTELGYRLFADRENIAEVVIPDTVVRIGASMFSESSVERVTLPHTLEEIACGDEQLYLRRTPNGYSYAPGDWKTAGGWGIFNADRLKSLSFSGGRASNDAGTYYIQDGMLFHRLTLDATAQGVPLEYRTVVNLLGITGSGRHGKLTIPDGVNGIVANAFEDLEGVTELSLPSSLVALGGGYGGGCAFGWMVSLSKIVVRGSGSPYQVIGNSLVDTRTKTLVVSTENTVIPADGSITKISRWAFSAAPEKVVIPDCVTDIAPSAFCCANFIRRIEVGAGAVKIMGGAFANIGGLEELVISERNPKYDVVNDCVVEKTELRSMITTAAHPKHYKCQYQGLTYYEFDCHVPYFCRGIVDSAFKDESFVRTVILPKEMQYVPMIDYYNETVASYSDVRRVEIADCSSQSEMEASRTYRELNDQFWDHTEEFEGFYWTEDPQVAVRAIGRVVADGFGRYAPGATVTLTANAIDAGCSVRWRDANGKSVGTGPTFSFTMPAEDVLYSVEPISVAEGAYNWDVSENDDGTVTIRGVIGAEPMGVLTIPATYGGKLVKQVGEDEERYDHERGVFAGCGITSLIVGDGVQVLGYGAFNGCKSLASVKLPSSLKTIRENCFKGCSALKSIDLPEGLQKVEFDFLHDTAVSTLNIPSTLVDIEEGALAISSGRKFTVAEGNPRYRVENGYIYDYVDNIVFMRADYYQKTFVIPDGAVCIAECCFGDCDGGNITIPASVRRIDYGVFCECKGLTVTFLGEEPEVWGGDIFSDSTNVKVYVQPGQGWDDVVSQGTWQGRPIRFVGESPLDAEYRFVPGEQVDIDSTLIGYTAKRLPSGLKYDKSTGRITGTLTKPTAAGGVAVTFAKSGEEDVETVIIFGSLPTVSVKMSGVNSEGDTDGCKVTGAGAYLVGKTVTLKATAPKGTAFAGFYKDGEPWPNAADYKKTSLAYTMGKEDVSLVAKFEKEKMSVGCVGLSDGFFTAGVAGSPEGIPLEIETQSGVKSVKVEKLPAGMKSDAKNERITGAPTKAGNSKVVITVTAVSGAVEKKEIDVPVAAMSETAVGTFNGFVANDEQRIGTFSLTTTDAGKLTAKVITAAGTVSFSGTCWDSVEDGVYKVTLTTKKGERLSLTLDSNVAWDADQLSGAYTTAEIAETKNAAAVPSRSYSLSAQRNAFGKTWYFAAVGNEQSGWTFAYTKDAKAAALTVTLKADGSTAIAGKLPNGVDGKGWSVTLKVSASGYANVGWMREGAIIADFAPVVTVNKSKRVLSIRANLWFDRLNDHDEGAGSAQMVK